LKTGREIAQFKGNGNVVTRAQFLPDGKRVLSAGYDGSLCLWDVERKAEIRRYQGTKDYPIEGLTLSRDGKVAASGGRDGIVRVWDVETGRERYRFDKTEAAASWLAISPDGSLLAASSQNAGRVQLRIWNLETGQERGRFEGEEYGANGVGFTDDRTLICSGPDGKILMWKIEERRKP
jgi:WD40 repeat protein